MRVKRLEIQGFKSFKDKTVIHFDHSITGIVGPNGCGKSNIVDAFFWVMGEQSYKHMRGSSSEDLIFNGSSKYAPLGIAEATLVMETEVPDLENGPAGATAADVPVHFKTKEISVTRRLYRSGEGEYYVNGTLARLKDIQELFMDTGVGAKGYSVIEQGQIGKIVNSKPEERRLLIEEAAGIAKYKARKKESLRKMESTQTNLSRLTDIIQEIEKSLNSLERQAQKAQLYRKYKDELFSKEVTWGRRKSQIFSEKITTLTQQREALEQELAGFRAELQTSENSTEVDRIELLTATKKAEDLQAIIQDLADDLSQEKSALELSRRRQGDLASQLDSLELEKTELEASIETDVARLAEYEQERDGSDQVYQAATAEASQLNAALTEERKETDSNRSQMDRLQKDLMNRVNQISRVTSQVSALLSRAEVAQDQSERLSGQIEAQIEKTASIQEELEKAKESSGEFQNQKTTLLNQRQEQSARLKDLEEQLKKLEKEKQQSLQALTQLKSRLQSLEELDQSYEGLTDGPKAALDWAKSKGDTALFTPLTDALKVTPGYENVLECWLESQLEHLLTSSSHSALELFDYLKSEKQGRVTLQLLQSELASDSESHLKSSFASVQSALERNGIVVRGPLSEFVSAKKEFPTALQNLIEKVCVVESSQPLAQNFEALLKELSGWSFISMDGVAWDSKGIIRGGGLDTGEAVGILRRKSAIEELKVQVTAAEGQHHQLDENFSQFKQEVENSRAQIQNLNSEIQALEIQLASIQRDVHQTERALQEAQSHHRTLERDLEEAKLQAERCLEERENLEAELNTFAAERVEIEENIKEAERKLSAKEAGLRQRESDLQSARVKEASLRERFVSLKREIEATQSILADRKRRHQEVCRTLERASREQAEHSGSETELQQKVAELTASLGETKEKLALIKNQIEIFNAKVNSTLDKVKDLHKLGEKKTAESNQLALEIEKTTGELSHLLMNLQEKYGPNCLIAEATSSEADAAPVTQLTPEEEIILGEEVEKLRERIRRLGEVNVMAIEEYDQLKKRYDHLVGEKADLERSLENLKDAIDHINKTSEERFQKAFDAIAERFERLFPIIFGGGQAKLSLVYPEGSTDILEAGVDILAQPPGKKVANITLLSGGEKALTAVSLIFAIFMVKPSPFCVLDEVDAPLDDANIGKFNALLREMSSKSQFILITHNKKTMELNDTLYGVTMEEPGVSKMVSIELR